MWYILFVLLVIIIALSWRYFLKRVLVIRNIKKRYQQLTHLPRKLAEENLNRQIEMLKNRYPNRPTIWYYEKALSDLERDLR